MKRNKLFCRSRKNGITDLLKCHSGDCNLITVKVSSHLEADFGKSGAESETRPCEQACNERQNPAKDLKRIQGCEQPIIQDFTYPLINLSTYKRKDCTTMAKDKNIKNLADFGKCAVRVAKQRAQHVPVKNLMERSNSDSGYEVECKGFEPPTIQDFTYLPIHLFTLKKKAAFTLAEVLITLGIIGVVAALTIPGLMTAHKKHVTAAKLKRAASEINQAIRLSENENGQMENWDKSLPDEEFINTYFRPYIKIMQLCNPVTNCGYTASSNFHYWAYMNGTFGDYNNPNTDGRVPFVTMDGILYTYSKVTVNVVRDRDKMIIIDINGWQKPNQFGRDVFFFYRDEDADSIIPYGSDKTREEVNQSCSKTGDGMYCAVLVKENGWEFPNDYPW